MITLICGLPRAGKTTYSECYKDTAKIYHLDEYGGPVGGYVRLHKRMKPSENIVVEGVYARSLERKTLIAPFKDDKKVCIWLNTPKEIKKTRRGYIEKYCEYPFEPPTYDEGWDEIIIIGGDNNGNI